MTDLSGRLAGNIRAEIARQGMRQEDLAAKLGISRSTLNQRLQGRSQFTVGDLGEVAQILGVTPAALLV